MHLFVLNKIRTFVPVMSRLQEKEGSLSQLNAYAMHYGLYLGAFWVFRYLFLIVAGLGISDRFKFLFFLMNIVTVLIMYIFYNKYKASDPEKPKSGILCVIFMIMLCFYASFLEGALMYAHFEFINPAYFAELSSITINASESLSKAIMTEKDFAQSREIMATINSSKITYVIIEFFRNIFLGLFLGVMLNFIVKIKKS